MSNKHMKNYSIPLVIRVMQIKTPLRLNFCPSQMTSFKKKKMMHVREVAEKIEPYILFGNQ